MARLMGIGFLALTVFVLPAALAGDVGDLKGTFSAKLGDEENWTIRFDGKGKFTVARAKKEVVAGTYKIAKDEVEFTDESGELAYKGVTGKYEWKLDTNKLTFKKVADNAEGREKALTGATWTKKGKK
jgi:hypothetical protein